LVWQLLLNGIVAASTYALVGFGFGLIYKVTRFFHFAHGIVFASGPYFAFLFSVELGLPLSLGILLAIISSTLIGCAMEVVTYRPLRHRGASGLVLLIASLGIYVVLQNIISLVFGDETKSIRFGVVKQGITLFGASVTPVQLITIGVSLALLVTLGLFVRYLRYGKEIRAVANDSDLARISGINSEKVILLTMALGSGLAGAAGILVALDVDMRPTMGLNPLMMGVVVVIIGGVGSIPGVALGAMLLGVAQQLAVWKISSQWQEGIGFVILLVFLLFRPQGFLGKAVKKATV
jgi:branched-chain amino acid transport system permease protein